MEFEKYSKKTPLAVFFPPVFWAGCILISALAARQVLDFIRHSLSPMAVSWTAGGLLGALTISLLVHIASLPRLNAAALSLLSAAMVLSSRFLELPEERIHLVEYAVLAALFFRSLRLRGSHRTVGGSLLCCVLVACLDEGFQAFLPWRVADIRDIGIDALGAMWGAFGMGMSTKPIGNTRNVS